jgi:hypothetical protein
MFRYLKSRKGRIIFSALVAAGVAAFAVAYWTASGTGTDTASVGTDAGVTVSPVDIDGPIYPGHDSTVTYTVTNNSANTAVTIGQVVADEGTPATEGGDAPWPNGVEIDSAHLDAGCDPTWFTYTPDDAVGTLAKNDGEDAGDDEAQQSGATLTLADLPAGDPDNNQDACKGADITLHLKVDNSSL